MSRGGVSTLWAAYDGSAMSDANQETHVSPGPDHLQSRVLSGSHSAKLGLAAVLVLALVALFWPKSATREAPGGFLYDPDGRPAKIGERMRPVTLLHFWATWCAPCLTEIPSLNRLAADIEGEEFAILMVAVSDEPAKVGTFLGSRSASALYDPSWEVAHRYQTYKLPETYLIVDNQVVDKFIGAQDWDDRALRSRLAEKVQEHRPGGRQLSIAR